jgi:membrane dipeptidase
MMFDFLLLSLAAVLAAEIPSISPEAEKIHNGAIVIDGHNDLPHTLREKAGLSFEKFDLAREQPQFHTDIPRLRKGGLGAQFWVAYVPPETARTNWSAHQTLEQIDLIHRMIERYGDTFEFATTAAEIETIHARGKIASLLAIEGGHSIENSLAILRIYHRLGVRYMTLTHSESLDWADSATDKPRAGGLNDFGRAVVREMNRLGMLVDISHVAPSTMNAALDISRAPILASHSSAYAIAAHPRNIPDDVLVRIKQNGGLVMVNFFSGFIVPESAKAMTRMFDVAREIRAKYADPAEGEKAVEAWSKANPIAPGTAKDLVNHIDHIVKIAGIDHVGLGSDYDGVRTLPADLPDVSSYPVITQELLHRGYTASQIQKILGQNLLRALRAAEKVAREWKEN